MKTIVTVIYNGVRTINFIVDLSPHPAILLLTNPTEPAMLTHLANKLVPKVPQCRLVHCAAVSACYVLICADEGRDVRSVCF